MPAAVETTSEYIVDLHNCLQMHKVMLTKMQDPGEGILWSDPCFWQMFFCVAYRPLIG
jgi:hypothetical protein